MLTRRKTPRDYQSHIAIRLAMLINAILIAIALSINLWSVGRTPVSDGRSNWKAPQTGLPDFDPARDYDEFFQHRAV